MTSAINRVFAYLFAALLSIAFNVIWTSIGFGATFTSFGPQVYARSTGNPAPVVTPFAIQHPSKPYKVSDI